MVLITHPTVAKTEKRKILPYQTEELPAEHKKAGLTFTFTASQDVFREPELRDFGFNTNMYHELIPTSLKSHHNLDFYQMKNKLNKASF